jgi:hypothetical protein
MANSEKHFTPPDEDPLKRIAALERQVARLSAEQALTDERLLILEQNRLFRLWNRFYRTVAGWYARLGIGTKYGGLSDLRTPSDYERWLSCTEDEPLPALRSEPLISVLVTDGPGADESIRSVESQSYLRRQIGASSEKSGGDYTLVLHAGDRLAPHALQIYAQALEDSPDFVYADEDSADGPLFKPGWSPELLRSAMYLGRAILNRGGAFSPPTASNPRVVHIPRVLYHLGQPPVIERKAVMDSPPSDAQLSVVICSRNMRQLRECVDAIRYTASIPIEFVIVHHEMPRGEDDLNAIWFPYRGPFDFARMNNLAAQKATSPYVLFMNDDVIVYERGWDERLTAALARPEIGIAGAMLQYPNGAIQHAGVVTGIGDAAGHCGRFQMESKLWPWLRMSRDVSAVTGAMLGIRTELFRQVGCFDEAFPINYNDVDLCLRVREAGLRVVCLDLGKVAHKESQTRVGGTRHDEREALFKKWPDMMSRPDEFYSPNLAPMERIALRMP